LVGFSLILPIFVAAQGRLSEIDLSVNNVRSGTTHQAVLKRLGKPVTTKRKYFRADEACSNTAETHLTLKYVGLEVALLGDGKGKHLSVYSIEITSAKWNGSGSKIGDTIQSIEKRFGKPNSIEERSGEKILYYNSKGNLGGVNFYFKNGKVKRILMAETLC